MEQLHPGQLFTYAEWPRFFVFRRVGVGQILYLEAEEQIAHISLLHAHQDRWVPYIMHLPISIAALRGSKVNIIKRVGTNTGWQACATAWRGFFDQSEAGAFSVSLRRARKLVEQTIIEPKGPSGETYRMIKTAYPVRGQAGRFSKIHASVEWCESIPAGGLVIATSVHPSVPEETK